MEKILLYERLQEYYNTKPKKQPLILLNQINVILEIETAKTKP